MKGAREIHHQDLGGRLSLCLYKVIYPGSKIDKSIMNYLFLTPPLFQTPDIRSYRYDLY